MGFLFHWTGLLDSLETILFQTLPEQLSLNLSVAVVAVLCKSRGLLPKLMNSESGEVSQTAGSAP